MSLESGASGTTRSSGGEPGTTRGLSRGAVFQKLGQQAELIRKSSSSSTGPADLRSLNSIKGRPASCPFLYIN
jgi:hypothetical protein